MGLPDLLRGHRLTAGLTQAELAGRAGIGVRTVRDVERGRSSRPPDTCRRPDTRSQSHCSTSARTAW